MPYVLISDSWNFTTLPYQLRLQFFNIYNLLFPSFRPSLRIHDQQKFENVHSINKLKGNLPHHPPILHTKKIRDGSPAIQHLYRCRRRRPVWRPAAAINLRVSRVRGWTGVSVTLTLDPQVRSPFQAYRSRESENNFIDGNSHYRN